MRITYVFDYFCFHLIVAIRYRELHFKSSVESRTFHIMNIKRTVAIAKCIFTPEISIAIMGYENRVVDTDPTTIRSWRSWRNVQFSTNFDLSRVYRIMVFFFFLADLGSADNIPFTRPHDKRSTKKKKLSR